MKTIPCQHPFIKSIKHMMERMIPYDGTILTWIDFKNGVEVPEKYAVFNMEDLKHKGRPEYMKFLFNAEVVYDYSVYNTTPVFPSDIRLGYKPTFCPFLLYNPWMPTQEDYYRDISTTKPKDIDVLFYGHSTTRRKDVIKGLSSLGVKTEYPANVYGDKLQSLIRRSKIVLSIGAFDNRCNDGARIIPALEMGANVVAEECQEHWFNEYVKTHGVTVCPTDKIIETCKNILR